MKVKLSLAAALLVVCTGALAQHDHDKKAPAMDPAMMEAMMKAGTPGDAHKALGGFAGSWTAKVTMWMMPGTDPVVSDATAETKWALDGHVLEQRFSGNMMGMPFTGLGYTGYDNVKKQYWSTWMDSMSTGMMLATGSANGNTWSYSGTAADPMTGKDATMNIKVVVKDADHHTMEMWGPAPDGKNYRMMEIAYSRKN